jgi:hypothetical protein
MRVGAVRLGRLGLAVAASGALVALGGAPAVARPETTPGARGAQETAAIPRQAFKVTIYPAYTTAGQSTTFEVKVANASAPGTMLQSVQLSPPPGFTLSRPGPNAPFRRKTLVQRRTLSLRHISLKPGAKLQFNVNATAPKRCGNLTHWTSHAFQAATPTGAQLSLQSALSNVGVTVVCPSTAVCGDGGPACSTSLPTSVSSYGVVSNASAGTLRGTIDVGRRLTCGAYQFHDSNWYDSVVTPPATPPPPTATVVPIVDTVSYTIKKTTTQGLDFCLGATYDFPTASGGQAPAAKLPTGAAGFIGLLPMCTPAIPPCISNISQTSDPSGTGYDAVMTVQIPESGDPWGGG